MAVTLNKAAYEHAESMISKGIEVNTISDNWEKVKPTVDDELRYLDSHTLDEYGLWFLGIDMSVAADNRSKFVYPYGDFNIVQESALIVAEEEAKKNNHDEIAEAAQALYKKIIRTK